MDPFITATLRYFLQRRIQHLTLFVTQKCNMRCKTCFVDFDKADHEKDLSIKEIEDIKKVFGSIPMLNIGGGEPFLRHDMADIIRVFSDSKTIGIPTNGWYTDETINGIKQILKVVNVKQIGLMISIDGFEQTHDFIRVKGSFTRAIKTLEKLREVFPALLIQVNTVLCGYNYREMLDLIDFIKQFKPSHHSIFLLRGNPRDVGCSLPPLEDIRSLLPEMFRKLNGYNYHRQGLSSFIARNYHEYMFDLSLRILKEKEQLVPCLAGLASLVIYADGEVAPCELLPSVGNIRQEGLANILSGRSFQHAVDTIRQKKCYCTHNCNMTENILFNPRNYPRLLGINIGGY